MAGLFWHILLYSYHDINEFVICCGYELRNKRILCNYFLHISDVTFDMTSGSMKVHRQHAEP